MHDEYKCIMNTTAMVMDKFLEQSTSSKFFIDKLSSESVGVVVSVYVPPPFG